MKKTKNGLRIEPFETDINELAPTSTLFYRQMHKDFTFTTKMNYKPKSAKDMAGITCYQNERFNYAFGITRKDKDYYLLLERTENGKSKIVASKKIDLDNPVSLKVKAIGDQYEFSYALDGENYENLGGKVSGDILSTNVAGGFTGAMVGLYATSANDATPN